MSESKPCCGTLTRLTPYEVKSLDNFEVKVYQRQYFSEAKAKCLICGQVYTGLDHPGYHFNYWTWAKS